MTYIIGGKKKIGSEIAEIIQETVKDHDFKPKGYAEPFCGMLGVFEHVPELFKEFGKIKYKAGDINKSTIAMWNSLKIGWKPKPWYSKKEFLKMKGDGKSSADKAFCLYCFGYMGVYGGTYDFRRTPKLVSSHIKRCKRISQKLANVEFTSGSYERFGKLSNYVIYCDPPYEKENRYNDEYNRSVKIDHDKFWKWCLKMSKNNMVFVSEYWEPPVKFSTLWFKGKEKLFLIGK